MVTLGAVAVLFLLDRLALGMERRGWIYWRKRKPTGGGGMAGVLSEFQQLVEPQVRHVAEDREERRVLRRSDRGAGGPPAGPPPVPPSP